MIPALIDGVLPEGIHPCAMDEVEEMFGRFQRSDRRIQLTKKLRAFLDEVRRAGIASAVVIDDSYVTAKEEPNDVDVIVALRSDFDLSQELRPFEYNVCSRRMIQRQYQFDAFVQVDGSEEYLGSVNFFSRVREGDAAFKSGRRFKGLLRVAL